MYKNAAQQLFSNNYYDMYINFPQKLTKLIK